ncbi:DUF2516 family protein [Cellulomonas triticagri]|uniref:DUF2516 family protein n=1 Tax=Cellulomonas triticagri TaxID=2483352 RepID=A0A3M2JJS3_9CELL|nr:DUF2516 family protein [Cellulomonas triticagri]
MLGGVQFYLFLVFNLVILALTVWALVDAARRPAAAFVAAGKQTKQIWLIILGIATAVAFFSVPPPLGLGAFPTWLALLSAVAAIVYLVDARPAIAPHTRRRGGPSGPSRGGW